jgi:hypothetical protein
VPSAGIEEGEIVTAMPFTGPGVWLTFVVAVLPPSVAVIVTA